MDVASNWSTNVFELGSNLQGPTLYAGIVGLEVGRFWLSNLILAGMVTYYERIPGSGVLLGPFGLVPHTPGTHFPYGINVTPP